MARDVHARLYLPWDNVCFREWELGYNALSLRLLDGVLHRRFQHYTITRLILHCFTQSSEELWVDITQRGVTMP